MGKKAPSKRKPVLQLKESKKPQGKRCPGRWDAGRLLREQWAVSESLVVNLLVFFLCVQGHSLQAAHISIHQFPCQLVGVHISINIPLTTFPFTYPIGTAATHSSPAATSEGKCWHFLAGFFLAPYFVTSCFIQ